MEDIVMEIVTRVGELISPVSAPVEFWLVSKLFQLFPSQMAAFMLWVKDAASPHSERLPFMNPFHVLMTILLYYSLVAIGCWTMKRIRNPVNVRTFSVLHNAFMTLLSAYMCIQTFRKTQQDGYDLVGCNNAVDHSNNGFAMAKLLWLFYFSKVPEFTDTLIMILKKNFRQVSFLHLYHHSSVLAFQWLICTMVPGGESALSVILNSFIHVLMYGYYALSAMGLKFVYIVKPYITVMQMTQFCILSGQAISIVLIHLRDPTASRFPYQIAVIQILYMFSMMGLFANFFVKDRAAAKAVKSKQQ